MFRLYRTKTGNGWDALELVAIFDDLLVACAAVDNLEPWEQAHGPGLWYCQDNIHLIIEELDDDTDGE